MGNHQEFSLCAHPQFSWSSLKSLYSQSRADAVAAWESQFWRPQYSTQAWGCGGICCWGRIDESLPEHCPQPMGATSPRLDPIPETAHILISPWAGMKARPPWPHLEQYCQFSGDSTTLLPPSAPSCYPHSFTGISPKSIPQSFLHAHIYLQVCFKKLNLELPYDPAIPVLGKYLEKNMVQKDTCTPVFIAALFTILKTWKQPKCPLTKEWIKKMLCVCIHTYTYGCSGGSVSKESACNTRDIKDMASIPGSGRSPGEGSGNPAPVFLPGESHGQRSLAGYSPWGHKELDTTEWLTHTHKTYILYIHRHTHINTQWNIITQL